MYPDQLKTIREAVRRCPSAFDERGRFTVSPGQLKLVGPVAISHRAELLRYVDELRTKLGQIAKRCASESGDDGDPELGKRLAIELEEYL